MDAEETCQRSLCECDKQMAANLANLEDDWEVDYHAKWGNFNRENTCRTPASLGWGKERSFGAFGHHGGGGGNQPNACCGKEGELCERIFTNLSPALDWKPGPDYIDTFFNPSRFQSDIPTLTRTNPDQVFGQNKCIF